MFVSREEAGKKLAEKLSAYRSDPEAIVIGLARGGVAVAASLAKALEIPADLLLVRKIGAPGNEELALGAIADVGEPVFNDELIALLGVSEDFLRKETEKQRAVIEERKARYLKGRKSPKLKGKKVILVDDGIATGASMKVAVRAIRSEEPKLIHLAIPVASPDSLEKISSLVDETLCLSAPAHFQAVGAFYENFEQVTDDEMMRLLA